MISSLHQTLDDHKQIGLAVGQDSDSIYYFPPEEMVTSILNNYIPVKLFTNINSKQIQILAWSILTKSKIITMNDNVALNNTLCLYYQLLLKQIVIWSRVEQAPIPNTLQHK